MRRELSEQQINEELAGYAAFHSARQRGAALPALPAGESSPSFVRFVAGLVLHMKLKLLGRAARLLSLRAVQAWAARKRIDFDALWYEPMACGLNSAWSDLGLALAAKGDEHGAADCLRKSWRVHPCPHSTSFGLQRRLLERLRGSPAAAEAVQEYERVAERFARRG